MKSVHDLSGIASIIIINPLLSSRVRLAPSRQVVPKVVDANVQGGPATLDRIAGCNLALPGVIASVLLSTRRWRQSWLLLPAWDPGALRRPLYGSSLAEACELLLMGKGTLWQSLLVCPVCRCHPGRARPAVLAHRGRSSQDCHDSQGQYQGRGGLPSPAQRLEASSHGDTLAKACLQGWLCLHQRYLCPNDVKMRRKTTR
mmetsp:Transcript_94055/g.169876  ORF Transcript_94055/g.169876 Transcript_94055/m.169876 type:complete len:201 (+) Transcript_94055:1179-1781(+)